MVDSGPLDLARDSGRDRESQSDSGDGTGSWLLALECATQIASAALLRGGQLVGERAREGRNHAETLLGLVDEVLADAGVSLASVECFAVSIGPGSFTSLRVGLATVKGLAFGSDSQVAPVSTLAALAWQAAGGAGGSPVDVAVALDARRGELYGGVFRCDSTAFPSLEALIPEGLFSPQAFAEWLPERCLVAGSGADLYADALAAREGGAVQLRPGMRPSARAVGELGGAMLLRGDGVAAALLVPRYLRRAEAEELRLSRESSD